MYVQMEEVGEGGIEVTIEWGNKKKSLPFLGVWLILGVR